jgi:hypothetical protein
MSLLNVLADLLTVMAKARPYEEVLCDPPEEPDAAAVAI